MTAEVIWVNDGRNWGEICTNQEKGVTSFHAEGFQENLSVCWMYSGFERATEKAKFKYYSN